MEEQPQSPIYPKYGITILVDSNRLIHWPAGFFAGLGASDPLAWEFISPRDKDSRISAYPLDKRSLAAYDAERRREIDKFSGNVRIYGVWGRGCDAFVEFFSSCPVPAAVLVETELGDLKTLEEIRSSSPTENWLDRVRYPIGVHPKPRRE